MTEPAPSEDDAVRLVRRRLLALGGKYVAPAVIASLALPTTVYAASCAPTKCAPANPICSPTRNCTPFRTCSPSRGG